MPVKDEQITLTYDEHFASLGLPRLDSIVAIDLLTNALGVSPDRIRPGLPLTKIAKKGIVDCDYGYLMDLTANHDDIRLFPIEIVERELNQVTTVGDYIAAVVELIKAQRTHYTDRSRSIS